MKKIFNKIFESENLSYLFFGILTFILSLLIFQICYSFFNLNVELSNAFSTITGVTFAYISNKNLVFKSKHDIISTLILEIIIFLSARLFAYAIETNLLVFLINNLNLSGLFNNNQLKFISSICKLFTTAIVIIINYFTSKFIVFKKNILGVVILWIITVFLLIFMIF